MIKIILLLLEKKNIIDLLEKILKDSNSSLKTKKYILTLLIKFVKDLN